MSHKLLEKALVIVYVEDNKFVMQEALEIIREYFRKNKKKFPKSPKIYAARSLERTHDILDDLEEQGITPDLVFHDCKPLYCEDDDVDSWEAGDELYELFSRLRIQVVVFSGSTLGQVMEREAYRQNPPLGHFDKPVSEEKLKQAIEAFLAHQSDTPEADIPPRKAK